MVRIVTTEPVDDNALTVYYKTPDGTLRERMLFCIDEASLSLAEEPVAPGPSMQLARHSSLLLRPTSRLKSAQGWRGFALPSVMQLRRSFTSE